MSTTKKLSNITTNQIAGKGVQALADRPNVSAQYGVGGLSPTQLKLWFDKLATFIAEKINELQDTLSAEDAASYIRIFLDEKGIENLEDLIASFLNGTFAENILMISPSASAFERFSLQVVINDIAEDLSHKSEKINDAQSAADNAQSAADNAQSAADNAQSAADNANEAISSLNEDLQTVKSDVVGVQETAEKSIAISRNAEVTADEANTLAGSAFTDAQEAKQKANTAMSIAKGANQAEVFDTVAQMNKWINGDGKDDKGQKVDSVDLVGMTLPAGTTLIYSADDNSEGHSLEYASLVRDLWLNGVNVISYNSDGSIYKQDRVFFTYVLEEETYIESISADIFYYNGSDSASCYENPRWTYVEGSVDINSIDYDLIKSHNIMVGQNLYIRDVGVPDYWWDGGKAQPLETQKVNLTEYADKDFVAKNYVPTATSQGIYCYDFVRFDENGNPIYKNKTIQYSPSAETNGWRIVQRDGDGFINAKTPESYNNVANKGYVDKFASVAKGANQAEVFDNVERMNIWIRTRKAEVKADSVTGMILPAGSTVIFSADPVGHDSGYGGALQINGTFYDDAYMGEAHGRFFSLVVLDTDTLIESVEEYISNYGVNDTIEVGENPRWSWTSETITNDKIWNEGIDYDLVKSHNIMVGQNFYIRDVGVPDYWWDGSKPQQLETQKVNLTDYEARIAALEARIAKLENS